MGDSLRLTAFTTHPHVFFIAASTICSIGDFFVGNVFLLTAILVYGPIISRRESRLGFNIVPHIMLLVFVSLGRSIRWMAAATNALSSPVLSIMILVGGNIVLSILPIAIILTYTRMRTHLSPACSLITFPTMWATLSYALPFISITGSLGLWTSADDLGPYMWTMPLFGPVFVNWLIASWAVVFSLAIERWYIGARGDEELSLIEHSSVDTTESPRMGVQLMVIGLVALGIPSFFSSGLPIEIIPSEVTALKVACINPPEWKYHNNPATFEDYVTESKKFRSESHIMLWPESAIAFRDEKEQQDAFERIHKELNGPYIIGVSFERPVLADADSNDKRQTRRNSIAFLFSKSNEAPYVYDKRNLVPIAESYSLLHSSIPPAIQTINISAPSGINKTDWAPGPKFTRPVTVSTSICLDFAMPSQFSELDEHPDIILAPAKTWSRGVGLAMWRQAKFRAAELDSTVIWCDGGSGGVSGIVGSGVDEILAVGQGSWVREIGIKPTTKRTLYAKMGYGWSIAGLWILTGVLNFGTPFLVKFWKWFQSWRQKEDRKRGQLSEVVDLLQ